MRKFALAGVAALLLGAASLPSTADAAVILGQGEDGKVYSIDTSNGSSSVFYTPAQPGNSGGFSPNALGYNGDVYNAAPFQSGPTLYKNGVGQGSLSGTVASGMTVGNDYYYVNNALEFRKFGQSSAVADFGTSSVSFGDIVYANGKVYASYGTGDETTGTNYFASFNLDGSGFVTQQVTNRYAGLAFAGGKLYGNLYAAGKLFELTTAGLTVGNGVDITASFFTDAATVPLPGAVLLFGSALAGLGVMRRRKAETTPTAA